ncbi:MAG: type II toxin-antitoxin system HigB family toxin [Saprospiraceae bacterium]|nr:type II toxin-antitoxin system HigB family toxin [Saprospiraceae bacterium]
MNIIVKRSIIYYADKYPNAKNALLIWYSEFSNHNFQNFNQLKKVYGHASLIGNERVIFNIKGNDYRLIFSINFNQMAAYIIWFGPHDVYDLLDARTIQFDVKILTFKTK